jgi:hypothetical protein
MWVLHFSFQKFECMWESWNLWFTCWARCDDTTFCIDSEGMEYFLNSLLVVFVCIVLGYRLDDQGSRVWFSVGAGNFSLHCHIQNGSGAHPASYPMGTKGFSLGVKRPGREADHSPPSSAEVKNDWSYTFIFLQDMFWSFCWIFMFYRLDAIISQIKHILCWHQNLQLSTIKSEKFYE